MKDTPLDLAALLRHLDARLAVQPEYADLRNLRGLSRAHAGDVAGAFGDLRHALRINPEYAVARANLEWLAARGAPRLGTHGLDPLWHLVTAARWEDAERELERLAAADADLLVLMHEAGLLRAGRGQRAALDAWAAAYAGNPQTASLFHLGAELAQASGESERARRLLAWAAVLSLDLCSYWVTLGTLADRRGEERVALVALRRAVQVDPERVEARAALGYLLASRGRCAEARVEMQIASQLAPGWADVRYQLGLLHADAGQPELAEAEFRAALAANPRFQPAQLALGCLLQDRGRDSEALALLQAVRRSGLCSRDVELRLAALHARLGHPIQARRARARARARSRAVT
jgi:tetratricopeptide (TPR) repeat protein